MSKVAWIPNSSLIEAGDVAQLQDWLLLHSRSRSAWQRCLRHAVCVKSVAVAEWVLSKWTHSRVGSYHKLVLALAGDLMDARKEIIALVVDPVHEAGLHFLLCIARTNESATMMDYLAGQGVRPQSE